MKITPKRVLAGAGAMLAAAITAVVMLTSGNVVNVAPGGDVQAAINSATAPATIVLEAGATYPAFKLKSGIIVQSSRYAEILGRVPKDSPLLAKVRSTANGDPVVTVPMEVDDYALNGLDIQTASESVITYDLVRIGEGKQTQKTAAQAPANGSISKSYIHGWPNQNTVRAIALNGATTSITDCYISETHSTEAESQAIGSWNGPGPFKIINNYLESAGEVIMFGGADSAAKELMANGIEIRRNHMFKPLAWLTSHFVVKNLLELKAARNVVIDGNVLENNWGGVRPDGTQWGQDGSAVLFTVRNQDCLAPWSTVEDVSFTNNMVLNATGAGVNFIGMDDEVTAEFGKCNPPSTSGQGARVRISNNVFDKIKGTFLQLNGFNDVTVENNTHLQGGNTILFFGKQQSQRFIYRNNVTQEREYGIRDETGTEGTAALEKMAPGYVFASNTMATPHTKNPAGNDYPPALVIGSDYRTPYVGDGANVDAILAAQAGVTPSPSPSVSPSVSPVVPSPSPTSTVPLPSPTPTATPTATPTPQPSPSPSPSPRLPNCTANQIIGNPARCLCQTGVRCTGNNARCQ